MPAEIDRHEVQRLMGTGAQLVEVMSDAAWDKAHITGAIHVPLAKMPDLAPERLDPGRAVITYCYDSL